MSTIQQTDSPYWKGVLSISPVSVTGMGLDGDTAEMVRRYAESVPWIRLRPFLPSYRAEIGAWAGETAPDICLLDFDRDPQNAINAAQRIHAGIPGMAIFAMSSQASPELIIEAMRSGCGEYLAKPIDRDDLLNAVARVAVRQKRSVQKEQNLARVLTFVGAKGGCGVTSLVTQMGALLAQSFSRKVLIVDLHPDFGDAALYLGLAKAPYHSFQLMENTDRLDKDFLQSFLVRHASGLDLIPSPEGSESSRQLPLGQITKTFDFLKQFYEFILVDVPPGLSEQNLELSAYSDFLYLIAVAEVSALRNVVRHLDYFSHKGIPEDKTRVVLNRHQKRSLITDGEIEKAIQRKLFWKVPNQYAQVLKTISGGNSAANLADSSLARDIRGWAETIDNKREPELRKKEGRGILGLLNR